MLKVDALKKLIYNSGKAKAALMILVAILAILAGALVIRLKIDTGDGIKCMFHEMTGLNCPTCGATRQLETIVTGGSIYQAFRFNVMTFIVFPILGLVYMLQAIEFFLHNKLLDWLDKVAIGYVIVALGFGVLRNVIPALGPVTV